jgi:lipopolysaccharide heptosyltransferase I
MIRLGDRPRFLICRLSAIGDTVHTMPLAHLIKERWPQSFVAWAVEPGPSPFVEDCSAADETIVVPKGFLKRPSELLRLVRRLRALKIDVALDPQSLTKSAALAWLAGAKRRIGFARPVGRELAPLLQSENVVPKHQHVVRRYLEVLRPLGVHANDSDVRFRIPAHPAADEKIDSFLTQAKLQTPYVVLNPGAGWDSKVWPAERYAQVAAGLPVRSVVLWSGERERTWAERIVDQSAGQAILAPSTTLRELVALVRRATAFVGSDTGPLHIAAAMGTPCVGLYGPTQPEVCGPWGDGHRVLQARHDDLGSARKLAGQQAEAMHEIGTPEVLAAVESVVRARRATAAA